MSIELQLHTAPEVPLEADALSPDRLDGLDRAGIEKLTVFHGNRETALAEFFSISGDANGEIHLHGDLAHVKHLGAGMSHGLLHVHGNAGAHLGADMRGGRIVVDGDAGDWVGPEMQGGSITINGSAGHMVGSAYRGSATGMNGGEIIIHGNARNETGHCMRNGLIAVGGDSGDFTGVNMLAGSIFVFGSLGIRCGAGMKRGTIVSMHDAEMLPTFSRACVFRPTFVRMYLHYLQQSGLPVADEQITGAYQRWCGDAVEMNRGEILLYKP